MTDGDCGAMTMAGQSVYRGLNQIPDNREPEICVKQNQYLTGRRAYGQSCSYSAGR